MHYTADLLKGRVALVTGAGRNVGRAIALELARAGAAVALNGSRDLAALQAVAREVEATGGQAMTALADVADPDAVLAMVAGVQARFGHLDIVVSNVALRPHQGLLEMSVADWRRVIDTNLGAAFHLARAAVPGMQAQGWGRIIHISGKDAFQPGPGRAHNVAAKAGLHGFTKALAVEFGPDGITVNTISPGKLETQRDPQVMARIRDEWAQARMSVPLRRLGTPEDVALACVYLCGPGAFMTGQVLHLNGGDAMF